MEAKIPATHYFLRCVSLSELRQKKQIRLQDLFSVTVFYELVSQLIRDFTSVFFHVRVFAESITAWQTFWVSSASLKVG